MRISTCLLAAILTAATSGAALAGKTDEPSLQDKQQAACYDDVQRLCANAMPDVAKVTACMKDKRPLVSKKCSDMWDVKS